MVEPVPFMTKAYPNSPLFAVAGGSPGTKPSIFGTNTWSRCIPGKPSKRLIYTNNQVEEIGMSNFKSFALALAVGAASFGAAATAGAADADIITKESVHINNQDLSSEEGVQKVYRQIQQAAENVCPAITTGTFLARERTASCRKAAIARAVESLHNRRLAEVASASRQSV
jgi:UrcA family protein